jgi:hypothetical protein
MYSLLDWSRLKSRVNAGGFKSLISSQFESKPMYTLAKRRPLRSKELNIFNQSELDFVRREAAVGVAVSLARRASDSDRLPFLPTAALRNPHRCWLQLNDHFSKKLNLILGTAVCHTCWRNRPVDHLSNDIFSSTKITAPDTTGNGANESDSMDDSRPALSWYE